MKIPFFQIIFFGAIVFAACFLTAFFLQQPADVLLPDFRMFLAICDDNEIIGVSNKVSGD
jgi:hypothetical protein